MFGNNFTTTSNYSSIAYTYVSELEGVEYTMVYGTHTYNEL